MQILDGLLSVSFHFASYCGPDFVIDRGVQKCGYNVSPMKQEHFSYFL